jgi:hypothetical protein
MALVGHAFETYKPHLMEAAKAIGIITVPLPVAAALLGYVPIVGGILALVFSIAGPIALALVGTGIQAEIGLRISAGAPVVAGELWKLQLKRMFPWFLGILVPAIIMSLAAILCLVPGLVVGLFLFPAFMVEGKKMLDVNLRSLDLVKKDWMLCLVPPLLVAVPLAVVMFVLQFVLAFIPYAGPILSAALQGVVSAVTMPFFAHLVFRIYVAVRQKYEQAPVLNELQAAVGRT